MGRVCGTHEAKEKFLQLFSRQTRREKGSLEDLGVDGRRALK